MTSAPFLRSEKAELGVHLTPDPGSNIVDLWPLRGRDESIRRQRTAAAVLIAALLKAWTRNLPLGPVLEGVADAIEALTAEVETRRN